MCLAIPGLLEEILEGDPEMPYGKVSFGGIRKKICLACVPEAKVGDYVLAHAGLAINVIDEEEAQKTFEILEELGQIEEELGPIEKEPGAVDSAADTSDRRLGSDGSGSKGTDR